MSVDLKSLESLDVLKHDLQLSPSSNMAPTSKVSGVPRLSTQTIVIGVAILIIVAFYAYKWNENRKEQKKASQEPVNVQVQTEGDWNNTASMKPVPGSRYAAYEEEPY